MSLQNQEIDVVISQKYPNSVNSFVIAYVPEVSGVYYISTGINGTGAEDGPFEVHIEPSVPKVDAKVSKILGAPPGALVGVCPLLLHLVTLFR